MKIGILTYHNAINYGAVLQAYALQRSIDDLVDADVEVIDYHSPAVDSQYSFVSRKTSGTFKDFVLSNLTALIRRKKTKAFNEFVRANIKCTQRIDMVSDDTLKGIDTVVVGSDQVWNPACTKGDATYLLEGVCSDKIKLSYAASMGSGDKISEFSKKYNVDYKSLLKKFDFISCREKDAAVFLSEELSVDCTAIVDPVLLYELRNWREFANDFGGKKPNKYIFVYNLGNFSTLHNLVKRIQKQTGYRVIVVNKDVKGELIYCKYKSKSNVGPQEFVSLLANAEYVVSDSFHATAFSIIFGKKFYSVGNLNSDNTNTRMKNILSHYGLEQRYIVKGIDCVEINDDIDFSVAIETINEDRLFAEQWLKNAVSHETREV